MNEVWKDIPDYEGYYQVSNIGGVKSLARETSNGNCKSDRILTSFPKNGRYLYVGLLKNNKMKQIAVHRLVLFAFIGQPSFPKLHCNHKNGIKTDNRVENLEWVTPQENQHHGVVMGLIHPVYGETRSDAKLTDLAVTRILFLKGKVERGYWKKLAKALNVSPFTIYNVIQGRQWKHLQKI